MNLWSLIRDTNPTAWHNLENPSAKSSTGGDPLTDVDANMTARLALMEALDNPNSTVSDKMARTYQSGSLNLGAYNTFLKSKFPSEPDFVIERKTKWGGLNIDQKVGYGFFMIAQNQLSI